MLRRTNYNPSDDELLELMDRNSLNRNLDIASMLHLLMNIDDGLSIFLDGDWGSGKSYFVKSLKIVIDNLNSSQGTIPKAIEGIIADAFTGETTWRCDYLPIYYNAWDYDHWSDPLASIACTLAAESDEIHLENEPSDSEVGKTALLNLVEMIFDSHVAGLGAAIGKTAEAIKADDLLEAFKKRSSLRDAVAKAVKFVLKERASKLLLIVDELDRCEPRFACRLLENLKALFDLDNVVVLYSLNTRQLARVIEGQYGTGFDGNRYLSKFYDITIPLRTVSMDDYLTHMKLDPEYFPSLVIKSVIETHGMSLREANRLIDARKQKVKNLNDSRRTKEEIFRIGFMDTVETGILLSNPLSHDQLVNQGKYSIFVKEVKGSNRIKECFLMALLNCISIRDRQSIINNESRIDEIIEAVAALRWSNQSEVKNGAYKTIRKVASGCFISSIEREESPLHLY